MGRFSPEAVSYHDDDGLDELLSTADVEAVLVAVAPQGILEVVWRPISPVSFPFQPPPPQSQSRQLSLPPVPIMTLQLPAEAVPGTPYRYFEQSATQIASASICCTTPHSRIAHCPSDPRFISQQQQTAALPGRRQVRAVLHPICQPSLTLTLFPF